MSEKGESQDQIPQVSLPVSLVQLRLVSEDQLFNRMQHVKDLSEDELQLYRLVKDAETGEHYLHYATYHLNIAGGGAEEQFHHLLPLEHDDVIALALGGAVPEFPKEWDRAYLRNGPSGGYVWFDPSGMTQDEESYALTEAIIREQLLAFRNQDQQGEEQIKQLLEEMDRRLPPLTDSE
jgi:hypothetical protein